jgi:hypothetical protein
VTALHSVDDATPPRLRDGGTRPCVTVLRMLLLLLLLLLLLPLRCVRF